MSKNSIIILFIMCLAITGCGNTIEHDQIATEHDDSIDETITEYISSEMSSEGIVKEEQEYYDNTFLENLSEALQARWAVSQNDESQKDENLSFDVVIENMKRSFGAEREILVDCTDKKFKDSTLQEYAISYMNGLKKQEELLENASEETFYDEWNAALEKRAISVYKIYTEYGLDIDSRYMPTLDSIFNLYYVSVLTHEKFESMFKDATVLDVITDDGIHDRIKLQVQNTSEFEFKNLNVFVYVVSDDGEVLDEIDYTIGDWKPGEDTIIDVTCNESWNEIDYKGNLNVIVLPGI